MNEKQNRQKPCQKPVKRAYPPFVGLLAAGVASYITALCYLPTSGIFSTLPAAAVLALAARRVLPGKVGNLRADGRHAVRGHKPI